MKQGENELKTTTKKQHGHHECREWNLSKGDQGGMRADLELYTPSIFYVVVFLYTKLTAGLKKLKALRRKWNMNFCERRKKYVSGETLYIECTVYFYIQEGRGI